MAKKSDRKVAAGTFRLPIKWNGVSTKKTRLGIIYSDQAGMSCLADPREQSQPGNVARLKKRRFAAKSAMELQGSSKY